MLGVIGILTLDTCSDRFTDLFLLDSCFLVCFIHYFTLYLYLLFECYIPIFVFIFNLTHA